VSLRVLTYNVQMRSWGMEAGAQMTLTPTTSVEERAKRITERIIAATEPWDVVCLNEVFDEDGRELLEQRLDGVFPHYVRKADADDRLVGALELSAGLKLPGVLWGLALGLLGGVTLLGSCWEDSGLMLFSRFPFAQEPTPQALLDVAGQHGVTLPATLPVVAYLPYEDAAGNDANAAKGAVYARLVLPDETPFHLMISHTQADPLSAIGANAGTRRKQLDAAMALLEQMLERPGPYEEEILFCGDLNVQGFPDADGLRPEWKALFDTPGSSLTDVLQDAWTFEQCPGALVVGSTPLPDDCDPGLTTQGQRLDYMLRPRRYPTRMVAQHIHVPHAVAQAVSPANPTLYTSDHRPLSIDLHRRLRHNTALTAEKLDLTVDAPQTERADTLTEGAMHWYRIDEPGGYGFALVRGLDRVQFNVYTKDDLSSPYRPYTTTREPAVPEGPALTRYALAEPPLFVRVWMRDRNDEAAPYKLHVRRFVGTSRADAIPLLQGVRHRGEARTGAFHSADLPDTDASEFDSVWHVARLDRVPATETHLRSKVVLSDIDVDAFGLVVHRDAGPAALEPIDERSAGDDPIEVELDSDRAGWLYVLVRREDPGFNAKSFVVEVTTDVSYLYSNAADLRGRAIGGSATLTCLDETDGFLGSEGGSDDIQVNVTVNGQNVAHVPHSDDLDFDDESIRDLVMPTVAYTQAAKFELVELDDLSAADRASVTIPRHADVPAAARRINMRQGRSLRAVFPIDFGDGKYLLEITVSAEPPAGA
jgi:hypothetical protein